MPKITQNNYSLFIQSSDFEVRQDNLYFYDPFQGHLIPKADAWTGNTNSFPWLSVTPDRRLIYGIGYDEGSEEGFLLFYRPTGEVVSQISVGCDTEYDDWSEFANWQNGYLTIVDSEEKVHRVLMDGTPITSEWESSHSSFSGAEYAKPIAVNPVALASLDNIDNIVDKKVTAFGEGFFVQATTDKGICHTLVVQGGNVFELGTEYQPGEFFSRGERYFLKVEKDLYSLEQLKPSNLGYGLRHIIELTNYHEPTEECINDPFSPDGRYLALWESFSSPKSDNSFVDVVDLETGERWRAFESDMSIEVQWLIFDV